MSSLWDGAALARKLGLPVVVQARVDSTMQEARRGAGAPNVHLADEQLAGRGRHGRSWSSRPGNLHATIAWPDPEQRISAALLAAVQVEIAQAVRTRGGPAVRCKWPNDGFVGGGKWCGLLAEHDRVGGRLLVGIGANLEHAPVDPGLRAAALRDHWSSWPGRATAAEVVLAATLAVLRDGEAGLGRRLARWPDLDLWSVGIELRVETGERILAGRYGGVGSDGRLVLETPAGRVRIAAGEARGVRRRTA